MNREEVGIAEINKTAREMSNLYGISYKQARKTLIAKSRQYFKDLEIRTTKDGNRLGLRQMMAKAPKVWIG